MSADGNGNIWAAGGEDGLFLLEPGATHFRKFTIDDGLHPWGYLIDGSEAAAPHYLNVLSVSGGPGSSVFVGYHGRPPPAGIPSCEDNYDAFNHKYRDASIYKSGDADRVTLSGTGPGATLTVVHYDIFSGPNIVKNELSGRERLCNILRIKYVPQTNTVWFGGNHGFAAGDPGFPGIFATGCIGEKYGDDITAKCTGNLEHAHPLVNGYAEDGTYVGLTDAYYGIDTDPSGALWMGGANRSVHYDFGMGAVKFWDYEATEGQPSAQIDVWPDAVIQDPTAAQRTDDHVSAIAAVGDGTAWFASFNWGLAHYSAAKGKADAFVTTGLSAYNAATGTADVESLYYDTDGSLWAGGGYGGINRLKGPSNGFYAFYGAELFGAQLVNHSVTQIQAYSPPSPAQRKVLVAFAAGAVGVYSGP